MASIGSLKASDGTGNASVATVTNTRSGGASTIQVDTVQDIPANFHATMGTPHTFQDPVTSEDITIISEATAVDFKGHVDSSNLEIDTIAPGYTDSGSAVGDIVVIKPTTQWADELAETLEVSHNDDGTLKAASVDEQALVDGSVTGEKLDTASIVHETSTPSGNSDSTGSWADWGATTTVDVPTWANRAIVIASVQNFYSVSSTTLGEARVVIGSNNGASSGKLSQTALNANEGRHISWMDEITLTATGSQTLKIQVIEIGGTGAVRVDSTSRFDWIITFLKA